MIKRTHESFMKEFEEKQPELFNSIKVVGKYEGIITHIDIDSKFGLCRIIPDSLLRGNGITITAAICKNSYALNELEFLNPNYKNNYTILSKYIGNTESMQVLTKYGICLSTYSRLKKGHIPSIGTAINKTEYFKNQLKEVNPKFFDDFEIISEYIDDTTLITVKGKLGLHTLQPQSLLAGNTPSLRSADNKLESFKSQLKQKYPEIYKSIDILDDYIGSRAPLRIRVKYGECITNGTNLLRGSGTTIQSAVNKTEFFKNHLLDVNPSIIEGCEIISEYITNTTSILISTKLGIVKVLPNNLLKATSFSIRGAINKTEYLINQFKEIHGDLYDYSLVKFKSMKSKVKIISEKGIFKQRASDHLAGYGCPIIGQEKRDKYHQNNPSGTYQDSDWINKGLKSKNFDSFKVYIIKCSNNDETFYKIGKTFNTVKYRFRLKKSMPYNCEIIQEIINIDGYEICKLERDLQKQNKDFKYKPLIKFAGQYECFSNIDNLIFN